MTEEIIIFLVGVIGALGVAIPYAFERGKNAATLSEAQVKLLVGTALHDFHEWREREFRKRMDAAEDKSKAAKAARARK